MQAKGVTIVGLDGATFDLIKPWIQAGNLPNIESILASGTHAWLRSTTPPVTPLAWSSFATGLNPGGHGVFGFVSRRPDTYDWYPVDATTRRGITFWQWAAMNGFTAAIHNMPMTYPPDDFERVSMVSGMGVPDVDVRFATPESLQRALLERFRPDQLVEQPVSLFDINSYLDYLIQSIDDGLAVVQYLLETFNPDLLCTVFFATDRVQHFYWRQMEEGGSTPDEANAIKLIYQRIDQAIGELIASHPERTLILMSDHGAGPYKHMVGMNQWLASEGWLSWQGESEEDRSPLFRRLWKSAYYYFGHNLPGWLRRPLKQLAPKGLLSNLRSEMLHWTLPVDWSNTSAYSAGFGGNIYLNLRGREPNGQVNAQAGAAIITKIKAGLLDLKDPETGAPVVKSVREGKELYEGEYVPSAPDLVIEWSDGYYSMPGINDSSQEIFQGNLSWPKSGVVHTAEHRPLGIFAACGPGIRPGHELSELNIIDLAPTILHYLGLSIPDSMEGRVIDELFDQTIARKPAYIHVDNGHGGFQEKPYTAEQEEMIQRQLRDLGYLD